MVFNKLSLKILNRGRKSLSFLVAHGDLRFAVEVDSTGFSFTLRVSDQCELVGTSLPKRSTVVALLCQILLEFFVVVIVLEHARYAQIGQSLLVGHIALVLGVSSNLSVFVLLAGR